MSKLVLTEQTDTPATPSSGKLALYVKVDGKLYALNSLGVEYDLTASGAAQSLADVLANGNATAGRNIQLSAGDYLVGESGDGVAGDVTLSAGQSLTGNLDGGNIVLIPANGTGVGEPGAIVLVAGESSAWRVALKVIGDEILRIGTTLPVEYDAQSGRLTLSGTAVFKKTGTVPATTVRQGALFVPDGSGSLTEGNLYFVPPNSGTPVNLSNPSGTTTLQAAYNAGQAIQINAVKGPVVLQPPVGPYPKVAFITLRNVTADDLLSFVQQADTIARIAGAQGTADGITIEVVAGPANGGGNYNGGSVRVRPGPKTGAGDDGVISFEEPLGVERVSVSVAATGRYPAPVLVSDPQAPSGSFGTTLGPLVHLTGKQTFLLPGTNWTVPNNVACAFITCAVSSCTVTLPAAADLVEGQTIVIKDVTLSGSGVDFTIIGQGGATIDNQLSLLVSSSTISYLSYTLTWDGSHWYCTGRT